VCIAKTGIPFVFIKLLARYPTNPRLITNIKRKPSYPLPYQSLSSTKPGVSAGYTSLERHSSDALKSGHMRRVKQTVASIGGPSASELGFGQTKRYETKFGATSESTD
jgi:hypothetical protein